jgi:nicotinamidase-related amidase
MRHPSILDSQSAALLIIDMQESFRKVLSDVANITRNITILVEASKLLNLPVFVTEQYPQGLGKTVAEISACLGDHQLFEKNSFSCCGADGFLEALSQSGRRQLIVCGIEAHVCVNQTVHDLLNEGFGVHLVVDAITSRNPRNKEIGLEKMLGSGALPSTVEMALFEMLTRSGTETFKSVQRLIK